LDERHAGCCDRETTKGREERKLQCAKENVRNCAYSVRLFVCAHQSVREQILVYVRVSTVSVYPAMMSDGNARALIFGTAGPVETCSHITSQLDVEHLQPALSALHGGHDIHAWHRKAVLRIPTKGMKRCFCAALSYFRSLQPTTFLKA
jgi:hypothetical protein